ncbi:hypothetical protein [Streptomyces roseolus]|uniref:hypothetical protein n=1 Tax=Streptomyces roseolus TaxID=67358 RepID=UPI0037B620A7
MSTMIFTAPAVRPAFFLPSVPLLFTDGDRYEWAHTGDVWTRADGAWRPSRDEGRDDGSGWLLDAEVRAALGRAVETWDVRQRFVPADPGLVLPGRTLFALPSLRDCAQYVAEHQGAGLLLPLRDLTAPYDEDAAYDVPGTVTDSTVHDIVQEAVRQQERPRGTYDEDAGRVYLGYDLPVELYGRPAVVECLHVFVLSAGAPAGGA